MPRTSAFVRTLAAALAIAAIAAPASLARPTDSPPEPPQQKTIPFSPESPLYWGFGYDASRAQDRSETTANDTPWATIVLASSGSVLLLGGAALASRNVVHARRAGVAT